MADSENDLDYLLARGRLSARRREEILDRVERRIAQPRRGLVRGACVAVLAAAAVLCVWIPSRSVRENEFAAKGSSKGSVEIDCLGGRITGCPVGSTLVFRFDARETETYFQAYAEPNDQGRGERIWYFPTTTSGAPLLEFDKNGGVAPMGIVLGPEHVPGSYVVHVVVSRRPLSRAEILAPPTESVVETSSAELHVIGPIGP